MSNLLEFPVTPEMKHRKLAEHFKSDNYVCFWFNEAGNICYTWGNGMSLEQMTYLEKTLSIIVTDTMKAEIDQVDS